LKCRPNKKNKKNNNKILTDTGTVPDPKSTDNTNTHICLSAGCNITHTKNKLLDKLTSNTAEVNQYN